MRRLLLILIMITFAVWGIAACKPGLLPTEDPGKPKITLERVEISRLAPWVELPAPTIMGLGFLFNISNPSSYPIKLENFKFAVSFEAPGTGEYMTLSTATTYDNIYFAPKTVSQYRVVEFLDSRGVQLALLLPNQVKMKALNLNANELAKKWFTTIGDFPFGINVGEGMAVFSSEGIKGDFFVPFEGKFPKK
ncbi:MAG: hypothetical protein HXY44_05080 [Syntrophaceae bacterium]|nr:hypothetical protein [Syntrophaceae bacterium]